MRHRKGFTLIELLVVIAIIVLLMAMLSMLIKGVVERARNSKTHSLIKMLDEGCQRYKTETSTFPPRTPYPDSRCLHFYLGQELRVPTGRDADGRVTGWKTLPPVVSFRADMLDLPAGRDSLEPVPTPVPVIDAWGKIVQFTPNPGDHNKSFVDIWSMGKEDSTTEDDITNWTKEY